MYLEYFGYSASILNDAELYEEAGQAVLVVLLTGGQEGDKHLFKTGWTAYHKLLTNNNAKMSGNIKDEIILKTSLNSGGQNEEITLLEKFWQISLYICD